MKWAKLGAVFYVLWGLLHVLGGAVMLATTLGNADQGHAMFLQAGSHYDALSGALLSYHSFNLVWLGLLVSIIAVTASWKNLRWAAWVNFALVGFTDAGLVLFMLVPGFLSWANGSQGLVLFVLAAVFTTLGHRAQPD